MEPLFIVLWALEWSMDPVNETLSVFRALKIASSPMCTSTDVGGNKFVKKPLQLGRWRLPTGTLGVKEGQMPVYQ